MTIEKQAEEAARLRASRDLPGSERVLRAALKTYPKAPRLLTDLAATLSQLGQQAEMEQHLRNALAADPSFLPAADPLSRYLLLNGKPDQAVAITAPLVDRPDAPQSLVYTHLGALRGLGRMDEGLPYLKRLAEQLPEDAQIQQELTASLVDAGEFAEAEARLDRLQERGLDQGGDWMIRGFLMRQQDRLPEAQAAYAEAVRRAPDSLDALRELTETTWMATGDIAAATRAIDAAIAAEPTRGVLRQIKARALQSAGDDRGAYAALEPVVGKSGTNAALNATASQAAISFDPELALNLAERAVSGFPDNHTVISILAEASLAAGKPEKALELAGRIRQLAPLNQHGVALQATAWRALGDDRYRALYDYERFVRVEKLDTPDGWDSLEAYLADLTAALNGLHAASAHHPIGQSVRGGSQTNQRLDQSRDPVIKAFFQAVDGPVRRYMEAIGQGDDPLSVRNTGKYDISGAWSVKLQPGGGRHVSHLHPWGWLSSACYLQLPETVSAGGREGWLNFGEPGIPTAPPLEAEHWIKPEPGMLVLFPSYLWHGTAPFSGDQPRLTAAFDVVPA